VTGARDSGKKRLENERVPAFSIIPFFPGFSPGCHWKGREGTDRG